MNQKIWSRFFFQKIAFSLLAEKTEFSVVKKAKEECLLLAAKDLWSP